MKKTVTAFREAKQTKTKLALLTAYDYSSAKLVDAAGIDGILVGDSLGMVCLGYRDTLRVTMEEMIHHTRAVSRGVTDALVIGDLPFMSYQTSISDAIRNAGRLIQEGHAEAVKLEGGARVLRQARAIAKAQIPVMGHLGLTPQSVNVFGGFKVQGRLEDAARQLIDDAVRLADAGVFAIVLECIPADLAARITAAVPVPTIGIGAGVGCDGQILVYHDLLGLYPGRVPKHVQVFADAGTVITKGVQKYADAVRNGVFPTKEHSF